MTGNLRRWAYFVAYSSSCHERGSSKNFKTFRAMPGIQTLLSSKCLYFKLEVFTTSVLVTFKFEMILCGCGKPASLATALWMLVTFHPTPSPLGGATGLTGSRQGTVNKWTWRLEQVVGKEDPAPSEQRNCLWKKVLALGVQAGNEGRLPLVSQEFWGRCCCGLVLCCPGWADPVVSQ